MSNQGFIVGDKFSAADIQLVYTLNLAQVSNMAICGQLHSVLTVRRWVRQVACAAQRQS